MIDAFKAAKEHQANLKNDQARLSEKLKTISDEAKNLHAEKDEASVALERAEKGYIRDAVTISELERIRSVAKESTEKHAATERLLQLTIDELQIVEHDIVKAQEKIISSRERFANTEREALAMAINQDPKFRQRILEVYAGNLVATNFSSLSWPHFLSSIFSHPTEAEYKEATIKFKQKHGLD